eukprot:g24312.t1
MPDLLSQLAKDPQLDGLGREPSRNPSLTGWHTSLTREPSQGFSGFGLTGLTPPSFGFTPTSPPFSALSTSQPSVAAPAPRMASRTAPLEGFFSCGGAAPAAAPVAAPVASAVTCSVPCSTTMPVLQGMTSAPSVPSYGTTTSSAFTPYTTPPTYTTLGSYAPQASAYVGNAASTGSTTYTMCPSGVYNGQLQTPSYQPSYRVIGLDEVSTAAAISACEKSQKRSSEGPWRHALVLLRELEIPDATLQFWQSFCIFGETAFIFFNCFCSFVL